MSRTVPAVFALNLLAACGGESADMPDVYIGMDTAGLEQEVDHASTVFEWLKGDFDSAEQAREDRSYFAVSLRACETNIRGVDEPVLYVEQAMMTDLNRPYRQRIYRVENVDGRVVSHVYGMDDEVNRAMIGACDQAQMPELSVDDIEERTGCAVWLTPDGPERFAGGTEGSLCKSSLSGASYATSEVVLSADTIQSWDQGWSASDQQVWGAVSGPYIFKRTKR